jgi:hypothetical protein
LAREGHAGGRRLTGCYTQTEKGSNPGSFPADRAPRPPRASRAVTSNSKNRGFAGDRRLASSLPVRPTETGQRRAR